MSQEMQRALTNIRQWAKQTVAFAMSVRSMAVGKDLDEDAKVRAAAVEGQKTVEDMWFEAVRQAGKGAQMQDVLKTFVPAVIEWSYRHMRGE